MFAKALVTPAAHAFRSSARMLSSARPSLGRVLVADPLDQSAVDILTGAGHSVDVKPGMTHDQLVAAAAGYDALIVRSATTVTERVLAAGKQLKIVGRAGRAVDNVDVAAATKHGVLVMHTPGGTTSSAAELTVTLMTALARHVAQGDMSMKLGKWDRKKYQGAEMQGKTLALVGLDATGKIVARVAKALGMNVVAFDHAASAADAAEAGVRKADKVADLLKDADFIALVSTDKRTAGLISEASLAACKKGVRIINTGFGGAVDEKALLKGLQSGHVAGAALDVFASHPPGPDGRELLAHERVIATPNLGAWTEEAQLQSARAIAQQVADGLDNRDLAGVVNAPFVNLASKAEHKPLVQLGNALGSLHAQILSADGAPKKITVVTKGLSKGRLSELVTASVLQGVLQHIAPKGALVNLISSPELARGMGISIVESSVEAAPKRAAGGLKSAAASLTHYKNLVTVVVETGQSSRSVSGSLIGAEPKVVQMDDWPVFPMFKPEGSLLFFNNEDKPGGAAVVTKVLSAAGINVASMGVARQEKGGSAALGITIVDEPIPSAVMDLLRREVSLKNVATATFKGTYTP